MIVWQVNISCETYRSRRPWSNLKQALISCYSSWRTGNKLSRIKQPSNRDFEPETSNRIGRSVTDCVSLQSDMRRECEQMGRNWKTKEARSWNHFCSGKAIIIAHSGCLYLALGIQHAKRMRLIVTCGVSNSTKFGSWKKQKKKPLPSRFVCKKANKIDH
jgi:hypothetical protein